MDEAGGDSGGAGGGGAGTLLADGANASGGDTASGGAGDGASGGGTDGGGQTGGGSASPFGLNVFKDGDVTDEFVAAAGDEYKGVVDLAKKYASAENPTAEFIKGLHNLQYMAKSKGELAPLPEDAPESVKQEWDAKMRDVLGVPATAGDYQLKLPEGVEEGSLDTEYLTNLKEVAHANRIPQSAFDAFAPLLMQREVQIAEGIEQERQQQLDAGRQALTKEYGDETPQVLAQAAAVAMQLDPDIDVNSEEALRHPFTIKALHKIAELTGDDKGLRSGMGTLGGQGQTDFRQQSLAIVNDPSNPWHKAYHDVDHVDHAKAVAEKQRLSKLALRAGQT